jgi:hypothetical protein
MDIKSFIPLGIGKAGKSGPAPQTNQTLLRQLPAAALMYPGKLYTTPESFA